MAVYIIVLIFFCGALSVTAKQYVLFKQSGICTTMWHVMLKDNVPSELVRKITPYYLSSHIFLTRFQARFPTYFTSLESTKNLCHVKS